MDKIEEIISQFQISGKLIGFEPYGTGHINETIASRFHSPGGTASFIHQRINHHVFLEPWNVMHNIEKILDHLRLILANNGEDIERGCLRLVPTNECKSYLVSKSGNYWRTYKMIEQASTFDFPRDSSQVYEAAYAFGKFQRDLAGFPAETLHETIPDFHNTPKRFQTLLTTLDADPYKRAQTAQIEIDFILDRELITKTITDLISQGAVPIRITHNDTKLNNVLMDDITGKGVCVIDLDTVMPGSILYDFGDMVRSSTSVASEDEADISKVGFNLINYKEIVHGYLDAARSFLTHNEIEQLASAGLIITLEQAIRFLNDYLQGDNYYKINYMEHNLVRARTQIKLVSEMEKYFHDIQRTIANYI